MTKGDCSTTEFSEAEMKRAILQGAERKILLADSSKWDQTSTVVFCDWSVIDDWVTDKVPASARVLSRLGVTIHASFGK